MREYYLSFVTGGFALLGVIVSNLFHIQSMKRSQKLNRETVIREKKELLYLKVIKVLEMPSAELSRGRGGPRCMSMPLIREDI